MKNKITQAFVYRSSSWRQPMQVGHLMDHAGNIFMSTQRGSALIVSLIILLVMTMIGITAMSTTTLEEKMAGNMRDLSLAFQAAETALREGEGVMKTTSAKPDAVTSCTTGCEVWTLNAAAIGGGNFFSLTVGDWASKGRAASTLSGVATAPKYILEHRAFVADGLALGTVTSSGHKGAEVYRFTGRGTGGTDDAQVLIQSSYMKRFD